VPPGGATRAAPDQKRKLKSIQKLAKFDSTTPEVRELARKLWVVAEYATPNRPERTMIHLATAIAKSAITYASDTVRTGGEDIAGYTRPWESPMLGLRRGTEDCDGKARLWVALLLAVGLEAEVRPVWRNEGNEQILQHVFGEVKLDGQWLQQELTLARSVLGEQPLDVPVEDSGEWLRTEG
jgi:transglutaminase-like putative cysteine protease